MIKILLVDDHPSVGEGTKMLIEQENDIEVVIVNSGIEALSILENLQTFDLILLDLNMPGINGLELTRRMIAMNSDACILIYTGYDIYPHFNILIEAGVSGFVSKTASREQLLTSIRCALRGESIIPTSLLKQLRRKDVRIGGGNNEKLLEDVSINEKEQAILEEISKGKSNKEVAKSLLMSQRTVEYHLTRIFGKLNVRSRAEAVVEAKRLGIISEKKFI